MDLDFVEGFGAPLMTRSEALEAFRTAASAAGGIDLVYLSAGVTFERFEASLKMAREAGCTFAGFMCGRAIWSDAVDIFGPRGRGCASGLARRYGTGPFAASHCGFGLGRAS